MRLLLIEDSRRLRENLAKALQIMGHAVDAAADGLEGDDLFHIHEYDAVILDLMLPGKPGLTLLQEWRESGRKTPVLILTALDQVQDRVRGLSLGADDYLVKPFALEELAARLEALTRRSYGQVQSLLTAGDLRIDPLSRTARQADAPLDLTPREFSLLEYLVRRQGQLVTRTQIETHLYSEESNPMSNAVDSAIYALRRKLSAPVVIRTRRGQGYILETT